MATNKSKNFYLIKVVTIMKHYDQSVEINCNPIWLYIPDHPYRNLITGRSGLGKSVLLNLIKHQRPDIDKIYLYIKDPFESKYQLLINGREKGGTEILKNPNLFSCQRSI